MLSKERVQVFVLKIIQIQTATSQLIYEIYIAKKKNSAFISILSDLSEKKK